jgi:hypothetical protein
MSQANYRVTITEHDYNYTKYTAWVSASSKNQALIKAAALAGQEKNRREFERTGRFPGIEGLMEPEVSIEKTDLDNEFWDKQDTVEVTST